MTAIPLQTSVAEKIKALYAISRELEQLFPGRHYTPDGHMIGSIGEALAASWYGLELFEASAKTHDAKAPDGRLVQIKATQIRQTANVPLRWRLFTSCKRRFLWTSACRESMRCLPMPKYQAVSGSAAEDLFIDLFSETFGAEKVSLLRHLPEQPLCGFSSGKRRPQGGHRD